MAAHAWILLEVTAVIVKQDILEPTVKQVRTFKTNSAQSSSNKCKIIS